MTGPHWSHTARLALTTKSTYCTKTTICKVDDLGSMAGCCLCRAAVDGT